MKNAFLLIPEIKGKIILSQNEVNHIGKREIVNCATAPINPKEFSTLSSVHQDQFGEVIKEQFNIRFDSDSNQYLIEDRNSTNGTYLGNINLKQTPAQILKNGDEIIVPIEKNGKLMQLKILFQESTGNQIIKDKNLTVSPEENIDSLSNLPNQPIQPKKNNKNFVSPTGGEYFDPTFTPTVNPPTMINQSKKSQNNALVSYQGYDPADTSASFILVRQKLQIPKNCFEPQVAQNLGLDFSMIFKLEWAEIWHISVAFLLLFVMIYHTYVNVLGIISLIYFVQYGVGLTISDVFLTPLPTALVFCITFICHELGHLYTGKELQFPSRFCLVKKGVRLTLISAIVGIPFGLPGASISVGVDPQTDRNKMGAIKMAGPTVNLVIGLISTIIVVIIPSSSTMLKTIFLQSAGINFMLGGFNMIPKEFQGFAMDGNYIISWRKSLYFFLVSAFILGYAGVIVLASTVII
ncbi:MAG: FHA domain-containing protein [Candidatus Lokiarchaeota archaeon]|nr:FHA domain-containing protein [Candidatus Harpocratesius repetitus]